MALAHTILAALSNKPCSGYDLSKRFAENSGCFWRASQQQIYRELAKLEDEGLIVAEVLPQEGRPDKKIYYSTETGREKLVAWISEPSEPTPIREDLLVKVLAGHLVPQSLILKELDCRRQVHLQQLSVYKELERERCQGLRELPLESQCFCLTLRRGIRYETEWIAWCDEAIALLSESE